MLKLGDKAPDFSLMNQEGAVIRLSDFQGKKVILYFYPKDNTPARIPLPLIRDSLRKTGCLSSFFQTRNGMQLKPMMSGRRRSNTGR